MLPRRHLAILLSCLILLAPAMASFEEHSLEVSITLNQDGTAHVEETLVLFISGQQSIDLYGNSFVFNDLSSWRARTGIDDLQNHITRAVASFEAFRIRPQPVDSCNLVDQTCLGTIVWEYDVKPIPGQTGVLVLQNSKPRTTHYELNTDSLNLPRSQAGDIILARGTTLKLQVPSDASTIFFSKAPSGIPENSTDFKFDTKTNQRYYVGPARSFTWSGETLPQFEVSFDREEPLEQEIINFFNNVQSSILGALISNEGAAIIMLGAVFVLSALALHSLSRSSQ